MELITIILVSGLASAYMLKAWRSGSIFAETRSWLQDGGLQSVLGDNFVANKLEELLTCQLCLSPYVNFFVLLLTWEEAYLDWRFLAAIFSAAAISVLLFSRMK